MPASRPKTAPKKLTMKHTKRELLDAYQQLVQQVQAPAHGPERSEPTDRDAPAVQQALGLSVTEILQDATDFRLEVQTLFTKLANRMTGELSKFEQVQLAVEVQERTLRERHAIEDCAGALAQLEETHRRQQALLTEEMLLERQTWDREKAEHAREFEERQAQADREHAREEEVFQYGFRREQQLARDGFKDKMARLLEEKEAMEEGLGLRKAALAAREEEILILEKQVKAIPQLTERAVNEKLKAAQRASDQEAGVLQKQYRGEKSSLNAKVKDLTIRLKRAVAQRDQAQEHIQAIALHGIEDRTPPLEPPPRAASPAKESTRQTSMIPPLSYPGQRKINT